MGSRERALIHGFPNGGTQLTIFDCLLFYLFLREQKRTRNGSRGPLARWGRDRAVRQQRIEG